MPRRRQGKDSWHITALVTSDYDNHNRANLRRTQNPTWEYVKSAILSLDAARRSDLIIEAADGSSMVVGGGLGRYLVVTQCGRESAAVVPAGLVDSARGDKEEEIIIGGCATPLPARYIVDEDKMFRAAERFFEDGSLEPSLQWEPY